MNKRKQKQKNDMGVHTWVYKKLKALPKSKIDEFIAECETDLENDCENADFDTYLKTTQEIASQYINSANKQHDKEGADSWTEYATESECRKRWEAAQVKFKKYKGGLNEDNIVDFCNEFEFSYNIHYRFINGELYIEIGVDNPFRSNIYHEDGFTDMNELKEFIKGDTSLRYWVNNESVKVTDENWAEFEKVFDSFVESHGKDNLFIELG